MKFSVSWTTYYTARAAFFYLTKVESHLGYDQAAGKTSELSLGVSPLRHIPIHSFTRAKCFVGEMRAYQHAIPQLNGRVRLLARLHAIKEVLHVNRALVFDRPAFDLFALGVVAHHHPALILLHDAAFEAVEGRAVIFLTVHKLHHEDNRKGAAIQHRVH